MLRMVTITKTGWSNRTDNHLLSRDFCPLQSPSITSLSPMATPLTAAGHYQPPSHFYFWILKKMFCGKFVFCYFSKADRCYVEHQLVAGGCCQLLPIARHSSSYALPANLHQLFQIFFSFLFKEAFLYNSLSLILHVGFVYSDSFRTQVRSLPCLVNS